MDGEASVRHGSAVVILEENHLVRVLDDGAAGSEINREIE